MLLRELIMRKVGERNTQGIVRELVWPSCDPKHFFRLPRVKESKVWRYLKFGRDRRLILDVTLNTMEEIKEVLGEWNSTMAWRTPPPPPLKSGKKRSRGMHEPEYFMLTDGSNDGQRVAKGLLSYCLESRTLTLKLLVARFGSNRVESQVGCE